MVNKYSEEITSLTNISTLIREDFNLDDINRIKGYWEPSKLNSKTVYRWLCSARQEARSTQKLDAQIEQIKKDFVEHLDKRIYLLEQLRKVKSSEDEALPSTDDPWISMAVHREVAEREPLVRASLHLKEILFACKEIIQHIPTEGKAFDDKELKEFIQEKLPAYLAQLFTRSTSKFTVALNSAFKSLERRMIRGDLEQAKNKLDEIVKLLKSHEES